MSGRESAGGVRRSRRFSQATKFLKETGPLRKLLGLWQIVIGFQNLLRVIQELINFLHGPSWIGDCHWLDGIFLPLGM